MDIDVTHDAVGTHFEWEHDGITPKMINWFWSNMEKWEVFGYRIHQWQKTDFGVVGKSSAIEITRDSTPESGLVWAKHFLPPGYRAIN